MSKKYFFKKKVADICEAKPLQLFFSLFLLALFFLL